MDTSAGQGKDKPKKYIRTLESDMATLKGGGIPDLAPLAEAPPVAVEAPAPLPPVVPIPPPPPPVQIKPRIPTPPPPPTPKPVPPPPPPVPIPEPEPEPPPVVAPPEPVRPNPIETYASDFTDRMKDTHASTATVLAAEQDSLQGVPQITPPAPRRNNLPYIIAGTLLLLAGAAGAYVAYTRYAKISAPIFLAPSVSAPIFVDDREKISGEGAALSQAIEQSVGESLAPGSVRLLYTASSTDNTESIFAALHTAAPDILLRNVQATGSMAGVVNVGGNQSPFFILSVLSYSDTFSGMLSWEPRIRSDLGALFPPYATSTPLVATSTPMTNKTGKSKIAVKTAPVPPEPTAFVDDVVANHDVRIYRDTAGQSVLLYGYWNQSTLVIARDPSAFAEILQRLATSRAQ